MTTARERYTALAVARLPFLTRAREAAALTIPGLIPPEGHNGSSTLPQPNQGLGARLVVHLASYFTTALLPPGRKLFRLDVSPEVLLKNGQVTAPPDTEQKLALAEKIPHGEIAKRGWQAPTNLSLQHLIVGGSVLEQMLPNNSLVVHPLDRHVVVRDPSGELIEFIVEQKLDAASLPESLKGIVPQQDNATPGQKVLTLYTWGVFDGAVWKVHQELEEERVPGSDGTYRAGNLPFFALRWSIVAGESYGRSKVEEHIADLITYDGLSKSMRDGGAMASRNITMIRPNATAGLNLRRKLAAANNGEYVVGNPEDVQMLQFNNVNGLQVVQVELETLRRELGAAFMLTSSITRNAERVTAEEIRRVGQELDSVQGGAFSMLSGTMLRARVDRLLIQMRAAGQMPSWPDGMIDPTILTGLEAMGREAETSNVMAALQMIQGFGPEERDYVKWPVMLKKGFNGLDLADAVNSEDEVMAIRAQRQQSQMTTDMAGAAAGPIAQAAAQAAMQ